MQSNIIGIGPNWLNRSDFPNTLMQFRSQDTSRRGAHSLIDVSLFFSLGNNRPCSSLMDHIKDFKAAVSFLVSFGFLIKKTQFKVGMIPSQKNTEVLMSTILTHFWIL